LDKASERPGPDQIGFAVLPRRWVVERFFAWIGRNRRLAKDFEASIDSARAFLYAASDAALTPHRKARMSFETDSKSGSTFVFIECATCVFNRFARVKGARSVGAMGSKVGDGVKG
jgi:transposase